MMRLASTLLVLTMLTTCAISGTFAKYTTQDSASDVARVAKWGVQLQVEGNLYGETYLKELVVDTETDKAKFSVQSLNKSADVVAPGTENNNGFYISLNGQPEVDGKITSTMVIQNVFLKAGEYGVMIPVDAAMVTEANFDEFAANTLFYKDGDTFKVATAYVSATSYYTLEDVVEVSDDYYPVVYTLAGTTTATGNDTSDSLTVVANAIAAKLGMTAGGAAADTSVTYTGSTTFDANKNLADFAVGGLKLTWAWEFESGATPEAIAENNGADTILGMLENTISGAEVVKEVSGYYKAADEYTDYCLDTMFDLNITVEQVD